MKTDRELLELAARAAGISGFVYSFPGMLERYGFNEAIYDDASDSHWNPLYDDGDALRLAVKLGLLIDLTAGHAMVSLTGEYEHHIGKWIDEPFGLDGNAATRHAIVRAAAETGESMK